MDATFFVVGKQQDERNMGVRARSQSGGLDAWLVPLLDAERFGDFSEANTAKRKFGEVLGEDSLEIYEVSMTLSVAKVEAPTELKRTSLF